MVNVVLKYWVDSRGTITEISGPWDDFCRGNGAGELLRENVVGNNLLDYISGEEVRQIYRGMHEVLLSGREEELSFDYRCDSPGYRRYMNMVLRKAGVGIEYVSTILGETSHGKTIPVDYGTGEGSLVLMCSWCKAVAGQPPDNGWYPLERVFELAREPFRITHGICPSCLGKFGERFR